MTGDSKISYREAGLLEKHILTRAEPQKCPAWSGERREPRASGRQARGLCLWAPSPSRPGEGGWSPKHKGTQRRAGGPGDPGVWPEKGSLGRCLRSRTGRAPGLEWFRVAGPMGRAEEGPGGRSQPISAGREEAPFPRPARSARAALSAVSSGRVSSEAPDSPWGAAGGPGAPRSAFFGLPTPPWHCLASGRCLVVGRACSHATTPLPSRLFA